MNLHAFFDSIPPGTVGLEEEVLLLDPVTLVPKPCAEEVLARLDGDPRVKLELPAAQLELLTEPHTAIGDAIDELAGARAALAGACDGLALPAAAALHPAAAADAELNRGGRYDETATSHRSVARRQLLGALQVHVAVGGAARTLAVYNALRGLMPELAALAAAAPFHENRDTGLASMRPLVGGQLPRQGVPPVIESWAAFEEELRWGAASATVSDPRRWWWEVRPHVAHGTLELRAADVQPTLAGAAAVAAFGFALVGWLAARHDAGERLGAPPDWRIAENRWAALRDGVEGTLADLETGVRRPTRERLLELCDAAEPYAGGSLDGARALVERNAAMELRAAGLDGAAAWLAGAFA